MDYILKLILDSNDVLLMMRIVRMKSNIIEEDNIIRRRIKVEFNNITSEIVQFKKRWLSSTLEIDPFLEDLEDICHIVEDRRSNVFVKSSNNGEDIIVASIMTLLSIVCAIRDDAKIRRVTSDHYEGVNRRFVSDNNEKMQLKSELEYHIFRITDVNNSTIIKNMIIFDSGYNEYIVGDNSNLSRTMFQYPRNDEDNNDYKNINYTIHELEAIDRFIEFKKLQQ